MKLAPTPYSYLVTLTICLASLPANTGTAAQAFSQTPRPIGVVVAIDTSARRITLNTDAGSRMEIEFQDTTRFLRVVPGSQDLSGAARITLTDVSPGDRILVRGRSEATFFLAETIIVMSKADLARKQEAERADWEKRGIGGVITALEPSSREATIRVGDPGYSKPVVLTLPSAVTLRRYSLDSVRFSDARASRLEELRVGDQVKARGTRSNDGTRFLVKELVSGSFRDLAATVAAVDVERGILHVTDLTANLRMDARVLPASILRRLSPAIIQMLSARISGEGTSGNSREPNNGRRLQTMIEALPALSLAELKAGDAVVISGISADDPAKLTAITVLAGVEPLLKSSSRGARAADIGSWNLDLNMGVGVP